MLTGSNQLTIKALESDFDGNATISNETLGDDNWYRGSVVLNAPTGYLIAAANSGAASKSIVCTPKQDGASTFTYYLKDITESSQTYGLFSLQKTTAIDLAAPTITATVSEQTETTAAKTTVAADAPTASTIYGTALADIPLVTKGAAVHPDGDTGTTVAGTWAWDETDAAAIYPAVNGAAYTAKFTPASADYKPVTAEIAITVTAKPITVTPDSGLTKTYGQSDPVFTYTLSGSLLPGDSISGALSRDNSAANTAGTYHITLGTLTAGSNYALSISSAPVAFTITKAKPTAVRFPSAAAITYGKTLAASLLTGGSAGDGSFAWTDGSVLPPVAPGGSTDAGAKVTIPVSSNEGSVKVEATVKDGTASVQITDAQIEEIASGKSDTGTVRMDVSSLDVKAAAIPAKVIAAADKSGSIDGIQVALPTGTVTLDKTALAAVSDKGGDVTVSVDRVDNAKLTETQKAVLGAQAETALVVDVTILASGEKVSAFGGGSIGVAVPYTPKANKDTSKLVVWFVKDDGSIEPKTGFYNAKTGKYEFQTEHLSQYMLVSFPFKDVSASRWYYGNVAYAYMNGLFSGTTDTTFSPETTMTRGMLVTVLWRMAGKPVVNYAMSFADVPADAYYTEAIRWAAANKIVGGYGDGSFGPNDTITREQMAAILYLYASFKGYDVSGAAPLNGFADSASVSDYAKPAMAWAVNAGMVKGSDNKLMPGSGAQRAQVAAILQRFQQKIVK